MRKDKKDSKPVVTKSIKEVLGTVDVNTKMGSTVLKPSIIHNYNLSMNGCDYSYYNNLNWQTY